MEKIWSLTEQFYEGSDCVDGILNVLHYMSHPSAKIIGKVGWH